MSSSQEARESETQQQQQQHSRSNPEKESRKPVVYDAKNIRVHFGGRWKRPSTVGIYTVDEYVDGRYLDILDVEGELINMLDLAEGVVTREPRLKGCTFVFYWLDNGDRVSIENESELLSMWANSSPDVHNNIHLFAETHIPFTTTVEPSLPNSSQAQPISSPSFAQHELPNSPPTQQQSSTPQQSPSQLESTTTKTSGKLKDMRATKTKPSEERLLTDEGIGREEQSIPKTVATKKRVQQEATETTSSGSKRQKKQQIVTRACREEATEFGSPREERAARRVAIREKQHRNRSPVRSEDLVELPEEVDNVDMLEEGMLWSTMHECRRYLRNYAIANKFVITFQKNEASRIRAKCVKGCPWVCNIRRISPDGQACILKKLNNVHRCSPISESKNKMADARWVARLIEEDENLQLESCKPKDIIDEVLKRFSVKISYSTAWAATTKKKIYEKKLRACSVCQQTGHSKMTCKNPIKEGSSRANSRRATPRRAESAAAAGQGQPQESPQSATAAGQGLKEMPYTVPAVAGQENPKRRPQSAAAAATGQKQMPSTAAPTEGPQCFTPMDSGGEGGQTNCPEWPLEPEMNTSTWTSTSAKSTILQAGNGTGEANVCRTEPEEEHHGGQSSDNEHAGEDNLNIEFTMFDGFTASTDNPYGQDIVEREQHKDIGACKLEEGMVWYTMLECRRYLRNYAIANKFVITFQKNEASRIRAKCVKGCPWVCNIRRLCPDGQACRLKKLNNVHTCSPNSESKNKMADARWVARLIEEDEKLQHESCKPKDIVDEVLKRFSVKISYSTAWSAKLKALNKIDERYGSRRMDEDGEVPSKKKPRTCSACLQTGHSKRTCKSPINEGLSRGKRKKATLRRTKRSAAAGQGQLQERLQNAASTTGQGQLQERLQNAASTTGQGQLLERTLAASTTVVQGHPLERPQSAALTVGPSQMPLATTTVWPQYLTATNSADRAGQTVYPMWLQGPVMNTRSDWTSIGGTSPVTEQFMRQFDNVPPSESTSKAITNLPTTLEGTRGYNAIGETNGMNQHWLQYRGH